MNPNLVTIRDLHVALGGKEILHGLNAGVARNRITALIGLNGCGKSTLLRTIVKEVPYSGTIAFHCGHDHSHPTPEHVGYVPQKLRIEANLPLTVYDLFGMALSRRPLFLGVSRAVRERMHKMLERVGALHLLHRPVEKISGGELQRVLLALALNPKPELLLLDEPAAGIDFKDQQAFYDLIGDLNRETGVTVVLVSHEMSVVSKLAHHVLCLEGGRIKCQGAPTDIMTAEMMAQTFGANMAVYAHHGH
jgi:zinc transport system ATP-binding protein